MGSSFLPGVAIGAIGGACIALAIMSALTPPASSATLAPQPSADVIERGMTRALGGVRDELRGIRDAIDARPAGPAAPDESAVGSSAPRDPTPGRARAERPGSAPVPAPVPERDPGSSLPEPNHARLRELANWGDDRALRRRWMLASARDVIAAFGGPDEIYTQDAGVEVWHYDVPTGTNDEEGNPEFDGVNLKLKDGRLIGMD